MFFAYYQNLLQSVNLQQNFAGQYPGYFSQIIQHAQPKCWVVIPTITTTIISQQQNQYTGQYTAKEKRLYRDVKHSYLTFQNVSTQNAMINVFNLLTGKYILRLKKLRIL